MQMKDKIYELRNQKGLSQIKLAHLIGSTSNKLVANWENGTCKPSLYNLIKLADFFNVSLDELCCRNFEKGKQGQWVWKEDRFYCSVCDSCIPKVMTDNKAFINETYKYCRWCGAKMGVK